MSWTDDRIALLKKMWKDGKSAADIAKTLGKGVTRNAVIGKAHRMGLSGRPQPAAPKSATVKTSKKAGAAPAVKKGAKPAKAGKPAPAKPAPAAKSAKKAPAPAPAGKKKNPAVEEAEEELLVIVKEAPPPGGGVALIDLTERMCKWPIGDPREAEFTFCGKSPTRAGTPYCLPHAALAYQSSSRRAQLVANAGKAKAVAVVADDDEEEEEKEIDEAADEDDIGAVN